MTPHTVDVFESASASTIDPMPPPEGETTVDAELKAFGRDPVDFSLLSLYPDHTAKHI